MCVCGVCVCIWLLFLYIYCRNITAETKTIDKLNGPVHSGLRGQLSHDITCMSHDVTSIFHLCMNQSFYYSRTLPNLFCV